MSDSKKRIMDGLIYLNPYDIEKFNPQYAYDYYSKLDKEGLVFSKLILGMQLYEGIGVEKNVEKANEYFSEIRSFGNANVNASIDNFIQSVSRDKMYDNLRKLAKNNLFSI